MPEHKTYHTIGPKDLGFDGDKKAAMTVDILRTTNHTGEQIHIQVPVYGDETREELKTKLGFVYSIIQDRMEEENKAVEWLNERQNTANLALTLIKRNDALKKTNIEKLTKTARKRKWTDEQLKAELDKVEKEYTLSNEENTMKYEHAMKELKTREQHPYPYEEPQAQ